MMANSLLRRPAARSMAKSSLSRVSRSNRWSCLAMLEEVGSQEDRLSNLPDDILLNIVERLDIADAARTSILSRRWNQIPDMLSKIVIRVGTFDPDADRTCDIVRANATVLGATRSLLESRTTTLYTIHLMCMQFFLGDGSISIGQTVANTIATQKVGSAEFTILTEKESKRCTDGDMLTYGMQFRSFLDACRNTFSCLSRLKLENLRLGDSEFPKIISICKRLELLRLSNCDMGYLSLLEVEHPQLRELEIVDSCFERVDLKCLPNLTVLNLSSWFSNEDPLSFGYVPLLQTVRLSNTGLSWHKMLKLSELLGKATIRDLHLNFESEKIWVKPEGPRELSTVFDKLRLVNLTNISEECDLQWTMFILQGAPFLQELSIKVLDLCQMIRDEGERKMLAFSEDKKDAGVEWQASASDFKHQNLSVLRIFGFQSEEKFVNLVRAVMEAAVDLKDIYLYQRPLCEECNIKLPNDRYPWTTKQRISLRSRFYMGAHPLLRIHFPSLRK